MWLFSFSLYQYDITKALNFCSNEKITYYATGTLFNVQCQRWTFTIKNSYSMTMWNCLYSSVNNTKYSKKWYIPLFSMIRKPPHNESMFFTIINTDKLCTIHLQHLNITKVTTFWQEMAQFTPATCSAQKYNSMDLLSIQNILIKRSILKIKEHITKHSLFSLFFQCTSFFMQKLHAF